MREVLFTQVDTNTPLNGISLQHQIPTTRVQTRIHVKGYALSENAIITIGSCHRPFIPKIDYQLTFDMDPCDTTTIESRNIAKMFTFYVLVQEKN